MDINDSCRFCSKNLRIVGVLNHATDIFDNQKKNCVERLLHLGVAVAKTPTKSNRICSHCVTLLSRFERDVPVYRRWIESEKKIEASAERPASSCSDKRDREPTPSKTPRALKKFCPKPSSPGAKVNFRRNITEVC